MNTSRLSVFLCTGMLVCGGAAGGRAADLLVSVDKARNELTISSEKGPVLVYACAPSPYKPYVRGLYTVDGRNVLLDAPSDHLHHHGLMYAIHVNGVNFWEEAVNPGREFTAGVLSQRTLHTPAGVPQAEFTQRIEWLSSTNSKDAGADSPLLVETRVIAVTVDNDEVAVEWRADFQVGALPVRLHGTGYNGLGMRFRPEFNNVARRQNSENAPFSVEAKFDVTPGRWLAVTGPAEDRDATVVLFGLPGNKGEARFFSMLHPFTYAAATQNLDKEPLTYSPGDRFRIRYVVAVYPGSKTASFLDQRSSALNRAAGRPVSSFPNVNPTAGQTGAAKPTS